MGHSFRNCHRFQNQTITMKIHFYIAIVLTITLIVIQFARGRPDGGCNGGYKNGICCNDFKCGRIGSKVTWEQGHRKEQEPKRKQLEEDPCSIGKRNYKFKISPPDGAYQTSCANVDVCKTPQSLSLSKYVEC